MFTSLQTRLKNASRWLPMALLPFAAQAQTLNYAPARAVNVTGAFTDLGTTGTVITTANTDDANSVAQPIGFTFNFNNTAFTEFILNTNGLIRLGATAPSAANIFLSQDFSATQTAVDPVTSAEAADVNLLMPFNTDLVAGTSPAEYRVATTGTGTTRVCTIQWKNVSDKTGQGTDTGPTQYTNFTFQLKLYEGTNDIEFVYGPTTASTNPATSRFPTVGIKGSDAISSVLGNKTAGAAAWSTTVFINGPYTTSTHNFRNAAPPDAGRTYRFAASNNDAKVTTLYTLGKVSSSYSSPVAVQAVVTNAGTSPLTNLAVTLAVGGATTFTNTQTVATLAAGASTTVSFAPYPVSASSGTNNLTVTAALVDDVPSNNSQTLAQIVSANDLSYVAGTTFTGGAGVGVPGSVIAVGYQATRAAMLTAVTPTFAGEGAPGSTYQVVVYSAAATGQPGSILYTSPARPRPTVASTPGAVAADVVPIPSTAVNGAFFVGIRAIGADNISIAYQTEAPLRAGTFFFTTTNGTTWTDINTSTLNSRLAVDVSFAVMSATRGVIGGRPLSVYPNPTQGAFTLALPAITGARVATAVLINSLGQQVQTRTITLNATGTQTQLDVSGLAAGLYTLRVQAGNQLATQQVAVE